MFCVLNVLCVCVFFFGVCMFPLLLHILRVFCTQGEAVEDDSEDDVEAMKKALQSKAHLMMAKHGGSSKRSGPSGKSKRRSSGELIIGYQFAVISVVPITLCYDTTLQCCRCCVAW